jgi:hypothetical protein
VEHKLFAAGVFPWLLSMQNQPRNSDKEQKQQNPQNQQRDSDKEQNQPRSGCCLTKTQQQQQQQQEREVSPPRQFTRAAGKKSVTISAMFPSSSSRDDAAAAEESDNQSFASPKTRRTTTPLPYNASGSLSSSSGDDETAAGDRRRSAGVVASVYQRALQTARESVVISRGPSREVGRMKRDSKLDESLSFLSELQKQATAEEKMPTDQTQRAQLLLKQLRRKSEGEEKSVIQKYGGSSLEEDDVDERDSWSSPPPAVAAPVPITPITSTFNFPTSTTTAAAATTTTDTTTTSTATAPTSPIPRPPPLPTCWPPVPLVMSSEDGSGLVQQQQQLLSPRAARRRTSTGSARLKQLPLESLVEAQAVQGTIWEDTLETLVPVRGEIDQRAFPYMYTHHISGDRKFKYFNGLVR